MSRRKKALDPEQVERDREEIERLASVDREDLAKKIRRLVEYYDITPAMLGFHSYARKTGRSMYVNPDNPDQIWTGVGRRPAWLSERLDAGDDLKKFLVEK